MCGRCFLYHLRLDGMNYGRTALPKVCWRDDGEHICITDTVMRVRDTSLLTIKLCRMKSRRWSSYLQATVCPFCDRSVEHLRIDRDSFGAKELARSLLRRMPHVSSRRECHVRRNACLRRAVKLRRQSALCISGLRRSHVTELHQYGQCCAYRLSLLAEDSTQSPVRDGPRYIPA